MGVSLLSIEFCISSAGIEGQQTPLSFSTAESDTPGKQFIFCY